MKTILSKFIKENNRTINLGLGEVARIKQIGEGGNGLVYEAKIQDEVVALKFLINNETGESGKRKLKRFISEYINISIINSSSNIVKYLDFDRVQIRTESDCEIEYPVIIMKRYDSCLKRPENPSREEFLKIFKFLMQTTSFIHSKGIIHRDLKPENILIDNSSYVLSDFGIASYNPEIFSIRAETIEKERLGNRLFSAPEQEKTGIEAHPTMDIYSIGQILQWYVTGETHRGTGRQKISKILKGVNIYDEIIDKCLSHHPDDRFQSLKEILEYINDSKELDTFDVLHNINWTLRKSLPKNDTRIVRTTDNHKILRLFKNLNQLEKPIKSTLWFHNGIQNSDIQEIRISEENNVIINDIEYKITELYVHYSPSVYNDYILFRYEPLPDFEVEGENVPIKILVDDTYYISYSEYLNGFAEIKDDVWELSKHKVEYLEREQEDGYFFIGSLFHCAMINDNDGLIDGFITEYLKNDIKDLKTFREFTNELGRIKHPEVKYRL